jgi:uncharacterized protein (DUF2249 family)/hemerythrin-like domain-containing protein
MTPASVELDVAVVRDPTTAKSFLVRFDALRDGESFVLASRADPRWLLHLLQQQRPEMFDWSVLEHSSQRFRVEVSRRTSVIPRSVGEYLHQDHRRLDAMLGEVEWLASRGLFNKARERFQELRCGLKRHIGLEDEIVFRKYEAITHVRDGPTRWMRLEHQQICEAMEQVDEELAAGNAVRVQEAVALFERLTEEHDRAEEHVVYPAIDRALRSDAPAELIKQMEEFL